MNVERFAAIVEAVRGELSRTDSPALLRQMVNAITSAVQQPNQPDYQQQLADQRALLRDRLTEAPSNEFSPAWAEAVVELGISDLLGSRLLAAVEEIFRDNEITLAAAAPLITKKADRLDELAAALEQLRAAFGFFEVGSEQLEPGEYEIGFLMPRDLLEGDIERLGQEFIHIKRRILGPLLELTSGSRPEVPVRSIASSEFEVFLNSYPALMLVFVKAVDVLLGAYQRILDIRLKHQELRDAGVPDEAVHGVVEHAEGLMDQRIRELVEELLAQHEIADEDRANELRQDLTRGLNALANRIDRGYTVEIRAGHLPDEGEESSEIESNDVDAEQRAVTRLVLDKQQDLRFTNLSGRPILGLPEQSDDRRRE